jgi:hypothetical protein
LKQNIGVTQNDFYAINVGTDEDYDDYGPMEVIDYEDMTMPNISDEPQRMKFSSLHHSYIVPLSAILIPILSIN